MRPNRSMLAGRRFGRLIVLAESPERTPAKKVRWLCRCDCGAEKTVTGGQLVSGKTTSCGCLQRELVAGRMRTHGFSHRIPEYEIWKAIRSRVSGRASGDPGGYYSARGIDMCPEWGSFERFYADMGGRPSPLHSIDRIDNDRGYWPDNCRWATTEQQNRNRRHVRQISHDGLTMSLAEWAVHLGIGYATLQGRRDRGWSIERMLTTPPRPIRRTQHSAHRDQNP